MQRLNGPGWAHVLGAIALLGLFLAGYRYITAPVRFTVAVAPRGGSEAKILSSFAQALAEQGKGIRLKIIAFDDVKKSAEALQQKAVDLAVVRPDVSLPDDGLTVAIMREEGVIIVAPAEELADLENARIGVISRHPSDFETLKGILVNEEWAPRGAVLVPLAESSLETVIGSKGIDALAFIGAPEDREVAGLVQAATKAWNGKASVLPIPEAATMALRTPALSEISIPAGSLGSRPRQPAEEITTAGVSYRLMAHSSLDRAFVAELTENLFQMRSRIAYAEPAINQMKAPDDESSMSATLPNHPGAIDYFSREQQTFMDRYGDWIWLGLFLGGGVSSAAAWMTQFFASKRRRRVDDVLDRLLEILGEARATSSVGELDTLASEVDELVRHAIQDTRSGTTDTRTMSSLILAVDSTRAALFDRRRSIVGEKAEEPDAGALHVIERSISSSRRL